MNLDLSFARSTAEGMLLDRCTILRDVEGSLDDVLDPVTLELSSAPGDATTVATNLPCLLSERLTRNQGDQEGGRLSYRRVWQFRTSVSAPMTQAGDVVVITSTNRTELLNKRFRIFDVNLNTLATTRRHLMEDEGAVQRR